MMSYYTILYDIKVSIKVLLGPPAAAAACDLAAILLLSRPISLSLSLSRPLDLSLSLFLSRPLDLSLSLSLSLSPSLSCTENH